MTTNYLENHSLKYLKTLSHILGKPLTFVDLEATGLVHDPKFSIIEIGVVTITPDRVLERSALVDPLMPIPPFITGITGITNDMVRGKKTFKHFNDYFKGIAEKHVFCGFNSKAYDATGIIKMAKKHNTYYSFLNQIDVRYLFIRNRNSLLGGKSQKGSLTEASEFYNVQIAKGTAHRAAYDIALTVLLAENILSHHGILSLETDISKFSCEITKGKYNNYIKSAK